MILFKLTNRDPNNKKIHEVAIIFFLNLVPLSFSSNALKQDNNNNKDHQELKIVYLDESFKWFTDRVLQCRKPASRPTRFRFVSFKISIQRMRHQPKRHAIQLSHVVERLRQRAHNAAPRILQPVEARLLVRHYRAQ